MSLVLERGLIGLLVAFLAAPAVATQELPDPSKAASIQSTKEKIRQSGIKTMTVLRHGVGPAGVDPDGEKLSYAAYDTDGSTRERKQYGENGARLEHQTNRYDSEGRVVEIRTNHPDRDVSSIITYDYDAGGRVASAVSTKSDGGASTTVEYSYDESGRTVGMRMATSNGAIDQRSTFNYDARGNLNEMRLFGPDGEKAKATYAYDREDRLVEQVRSNPTGLLSRRTKYGYDERGNQTRIANYDADQRLVSETLRRYDDADNVIEASSSLPSAGLRTRITYQYDGKGNLLEQVKYNKLDEPVEVIRNVYEYYD